MAAIHHAGNSSRLTLSDFHAWTDIEGNPPWARLMLEASGYRFNKDADCWVHSVKGRVLGRQTLRAHDAEWLARWIDGK